MAPSSAHGGEGLVQSWLEACATMHRACVVGLGFLTRWLVPNPFLRGWTW